MKLLANYKNKTFSKDGKINLMFAIEPRYLSLAEGLKNEQYTLDIKKVSNKRSVKQNSMLWALINEICMVENGDTSSSEDLYLRLLEMSGAKSTFITIKKDAIDDFKSLARHIRIVDETLYKGVPYCTVEVFYGSSTFNSKEMSQLIDTTLKDASEVGIETDYWEDLLNVWRNFEAIFGGMAHQKRDN